MTRRSGPQAGMAIVRVERDADAGGRILVRVRTVDDVLGGTAGEERSFACAPEAVDWLRRWLELWTEQR